MGSGQTQPGAVDLSIVTSGHDVADARLHRVVAALRRSEVRVEVLGLGDASAGPVGAVVRTRRRAGGMRRAWTAVRLPWLATADVVMALDPDSTAGAWWWRTVRRLLRRPALMVADVHEDYALVLRDRAWARGLRGIGGAVWARLGDVAARRADLLVVADDHLMVDSERRVVLRNLPDRSMLPAPTDRGPVPRALYVGDLRRSRGLFAMLDAVALAPGWELDLVGPIAAQDLAAARQRFADPELADRVRWHDRLPPARAWALADGAWVGLLLLEDTPAFREALPSKLYEYLTCGMAVLTTDLPRSAELVRRSGAGAVVADAREAAELLREWAAAPAGVDGLRARARAWAEENGAEPAAEFVAAVASLLDGP